MGRRSRKRPPGAPSGGTGGSSAQAGVRAEGRTPPGSANGQPARRAAPPPAQRRRAGAERPPAPWGSFPLVELCTLIALVLGVTGFVVRGHRGMVMIVGAAALGSLAGLELSIREHFAGFRSHSTLLAGVVAIAVAAVLFLVIHPPRGIAFAIAAAAFLVALRGFQTIFRRRSGGLTFR